MTEYIVEPKSRLQLRELARMLRRYLKLENEKYFPITELLDVLAEVFDNFSYEVVEDSELPMALMQIRMCEQDISVSRKRV